MKNFNQALRDYENEQLNNYLASEDLDIDDDNFEEEEICEECEDKKDCELLTEQERLMELSDAEYSLTEEHEERI